MRLPPWILPAVLAAACSGSDGDLGPGPDDPEGDVLVRNNRFDPTALTVGTGATVTWAWVADAVTHNVTFAQGGSGNRASGTFERTFDTPGTFPYLCTIHGQAMSGIVTVEDEPPPDSGGDGGPDDPGGY